MKLLKSLLALTLALALAGAAIAGSGAGIGQYIGGAEATATGTTYASVTELSNESHNGAVETLTLSTTGVVSWEHMTADAETVTVELQVKNGANYETVATKNYSVDAGSSGEYSYDRVSGDVLDATSYDAEDFSASEDGETQRKYLTTRVVVTVTDANGNTCEFTERHKVITEVTNLLDPTVSGDTDVDGSVGMADTDDCVACEQVSDASGADDHHHD
jgi:hypothetical protein